MNGRDKRETGGHDVPQTPAHVVRLPALHLTVATISATHRGGVGEFNSPASRVKEPR